MRVRARHAARVRGVLASTVARPQAAALWPSGHGSYASSRRSSAPKTERANVEHVGHATYAETVLEWETCSFMRTLPVRLSNGMRIVT